MSNVYSTWVYNSSNPVPDANRVFIVQNTPVQISSAGLTACVPMYMAVGDCPNCATADIIWTKMYSCSEPVEVCPDNNVIYLTVPGKYSFGDPLVPLVLAGDVNVRHATMNGMSIEQALSLGKCAAQPESPLPVELVLPLVDSTLCDGSIVPVEALATVVKGVVNVKICNNKEFDTLELCDPTTGVPVILVTTYSAAGLPSTFAYNLNGTAYLGPITSLVACADKDRESDALIWCQTIGTVQTNLTQWVMKQDGVPTGVIYWTNFAGAVVPAPLPANCRLGVCIAPLATVNVNSDGVTIAGPGRSARAPFIGAVGAFSTASIPDLLHSVTVVALSVQNGLPGLTANQVIVTMPGGGAIALFDGESRTFSVERDKDEQLKREFTFTASGLAYANITYTFV